MENKGIDIPKIRVSVLTAHTAGNHVKVELVSGDVYTHQTQPGELELWNLPFEYWHNSLPSTCRDEL
jgi:hypothetical protein